MAKVLNEGAGCKVDGTGAFEPIPRRKAKPQTPTRTNRTETMEGHYETAWKDSIAAAVTASNYLQCDDNNLCIEGALGQVIDFFNPLAVGQDIIDIVGGGED